MRSFPKYRIPVIIGWLLPPVLSFFILRDLPLHLILKIVIFPFLAALLFFAEVLIAMKIGRIWNNWQRRKEKEASREAVSFRRKIPKRILTTTQH